ncbi:MAG TPA: L,D-transpeptidase family protein [Actinomycetes bacterium]|nr:L,D-transpeptidase family protein [Actinomycetes bacterium]
MGPLDRLRPLGSRLRGWRPTGWRPTGWRPSGWRPRDWLLRGRQLLGWQRIAVVAGLTVLLLAAGTVAATAKVRGSADRILAGVTVAGVDVGGMTHDQAVAAVGARTAPVLRRRVMVTAAGKRWPATPAGLGRDAAVEQAVDLAMDGPRLSFAADAWHRLFNRPVTLSVPLRWSDDSDRVAGFVRALAPKLALPATDASIQLVDGKVVVQHAKNGRAVDVAASTRSLLAAMRANRGTARLVTRPVAPKVTADQLGKTIVVDTTTNLLTVYQGLKVIRTYPVATAQAGFVTPAGSWKVVYKVANPTWHNPAPDTWGKDEPLVIPPGPGNPLGTRAMYLNAPGIRIHGTYATGSIGTHASHGCIRMRIPDSEELFPMIPVGTPVLVHR